MTAECFRCGGEATESFGNGYLCDECIPIGEDTGEDDSDPVSPSRDTCSPDQPDADSIDPEAILDVELDVYPSDLLDVDRWLTWKPTDDGRKVPRAPYANPDWPDKFVSAQDPDVWTNFETASTAVADRRDYGLAFNIPDADEYSDDPFVLIDYDNVRDPETREVHPTVRDHIKRAESYADVSTSGTGVHIFARGALPDGVKAIEAALPAVDGFGEAEIEVYDSARYSAMTGAHIAASPRRTTDAQDLIDDLADEYATVAEGTPDELTREPEKSRDEIVNVETTTDIQDVLDAIQHVRPHDIRLRSTVTHERADGTKSLDPSWANSDSGTRLAQVDDGWVYRKGMHGLDALQLVALEERIISHVDEYPTSEGFWNAVDALRDRGAHIPEFDPASDDAGAVSALPIEQLDALSPAERRRAAKKRGLEWPSTDDAREDLFDAIAEVIRYEDNWIIDAPTSLGKSYTIASTRWGARQDITGDRPVVHLLETRDARDEAVDVAEEHGGQYHVLLGRHEACPVAGGEHDDEITIDGTPASDWLDSQCDGKGMAFSAAHRYLEEHNDQGIHLPCTEEGHCTATKQWDEYREGPGGELEYWPLVIATHNFAYAPGLRMHNNVVVDEQPNFETDLSTDRIRRAVGAYLHEIDAPVTTWEAFIQLSRHDDYQGDAAKERDALEDVLYEEPDHDWYFENPDAHTLAPALARAIFRAEDRANGRRFGKTMHEPPRLEATVRDDDDWNREWVSIVLDESNDVRSVRVVPDFGSARSVIGMDAHPAVPLWQANTLPWIKTTQILEPEQRQLWRRYERGLRVVQVGDATRPLSGDKALEWLNEDKLEALFEHLVDEYGPQFRTAITTAQVEDRLEELMAEAGVHRPELMHFGEEKSRNDFENERIGLVNGCMDPGDDYVLDLLAELDLEAEAETAVDDAGEEYRARGRGFEGKDADAADEILASVRENHIAQAAGRYARDPSDPDVTATVFVRTDAMPAGFADVQTPGVEWVFTDLQEEIVEELRSSKRSKTVREIAEAVGCSKEHVRQTLERLSDSEFGESAVHISEGAGSHGATLYSESGLPSTGFVDLEESPTEPYRDSSRWALAIRDPSPSTAAARTVSDDHDRPSTEVWDWKSHPSPSD
ncbi:hypothetical protein [Natronorubrum sp. FCH18a]|uniref:hypothetical protein n=1 Tax=Natronorubrum sp. FCH18a TaxID=3447018 RepID=UPI003F5103EA